MDMDDLDLHLRIGLVLLDLEVRAGGFGAEPRCRRLGAFASPWELVAVALKLDDRLDHDGWYYGVRAV